MERKFDELFFDIRTGGTSRNVMIFPSDSYPFGCAYSPEYFAQHSEHITLPSELQE